MLTVLNLCLLKNDLNCRVKRPLAAFLWCISERLKRVSERLKRASSEPEQRQRFVALPSQLLRRLFWDEIRSSAGTRLRTSETHVSCPSLRQNEHLTDCPK